MVRVGERMQLHFALTAMVLYLPRVLTDMLQYQRHSNKTTLAGWLLRTA